MIKYQEIKKANENGEKVGTGVHRAIKIDNDGKKKVIAIFGTVRTLAEKEIIFLDDKPVTDYWIVLMTDTDVSSHGLVNITACKDYIEMVTG